MSQDEQAIRALVEKWMTATKAGDTETVLSLMTEDVVFMVPGKEPFGKQAFAAASAQMKGLQIDGHSDIVEIQVHGHWAWLRNHLEVKVTPTNGAPVTRKGYTLTLFQKQPDGRWLLTRDANLLA